MYVKNVQQMYNIFIRHYIIEVQFILLHNLHAYIK